MAVTGSLDAAVAAASAKKKVKRKPKVTSSVDAALAAARAKTPKKTSVEIIQAQTGMATKEIKAAQKAGKVKLKRAKKATELKPRASSPTLSDRIFADSEEIADPNDIFVDKKGVSHFSDYAPKGVTLIRALTGDQPGNAGLPTPGEYVAAATGVIAGAGGAALRATKLPGIVRAADRAQTVSRQVKGAKVYRAKKATEGAGKAKKATATVKAKTLARYSKPGRKGRRAGRKRRAANYALNPVTPAAAQSPSVKGAVGGHYKALKEDPIGTLKTTERAALGMPFAVAADVADLVTLNFGDFAKSQGDYLKTVGKLFEGDSDKAAKVIKEDVGLIPAITGGLAGVAAKRGVGAVRGTPIKKVKPKLIRSHKRDVEIANDKSAPRDARKQARDRLEGGNYREPRRKAHANRKREGERSGQTAEVEQGVTSAEMRGGGKRRVKAGPRRTIEADTAKLHKRRIGKSHITEADTLNLVGRLGLSGSEPNLVGILKRERANLKDSRREIDPDSAHTRAVLDALIAHPEVVGRVQSVLDRLESVQGGRGVERGREVGEDGPTLSDEEVRYSGVMQNEGILRGNERLPGELEGKTRIRHTSAKTIRVQEGRKRVEQVEIPAHEVRQGDRIKPKGESKWLTVSISEASPGRWNLHASGNRYHDIRLARNDAVEVRREVQPKITELPFTNVRFREGPLKTRVKPGPKIEQRLRGASKHALRRARNLRKTADELEAKNRPAHAAKLRQRADKNELQAAKQLEVVDRFRRAAGLDRKAAKLEAKGKIAEAVTARVEATELRNAAMADQRSLSEAAVTEARAKVNETGRREPIYNAQQDVTEPASSPNSGVPFSRKAKKEQYRTGELARQGRIDESALTLLTNLHTQRAALSERQRARGFIEERALVADGERLGTRDWWAKHQRAGRFPSGYDLVPVGEFAPAIQRTPALRAEVEAKRLDVEAEGKGTILMGLPRSAIKEYRAQAKPVADAARYVRNVGRIQTVGMLATNSPWFVMQIPATLATMAARNPNPARWVRGTQAMIEGWRHNDPKTRATFQGMFGGNPADFLAVGENVRGVSPYRTSDIKGALDLGLNSPAGNVVKSLWEFTKKGGPLIRANRRMEAALRELAAQMEIDRISGLDRYGNVRLSARPLEFIGRVADGTNAIYRHMDDLRGKTPAERNRWYAERPNRMQEIVEPLQKAAGDWTSMTARERAWTGFIPFYPFFRFSLRYIHYEFPKQNPAKAAIAFNLAQSNAIELEQLLGGPPGFFSGWGQMVTHIGEGEQLFDVSRAAPGGNALIQTFGDSSELNLHTLTGPLQPVMNTAIMALDRKDSFGNPKEDRSQSALFLGGLASLNNLTRSQRDHFLPPSEISQLFRAITEPNRTTGILPQIQMDIDAERDAVRLSALLDKAYAIDDFGSKSEIPLHGPEHAAYTKAKRFSEKAWKEINEMIVEYGVQTKAEQGQESRKAKKRWAGNTFGVTEPTVDTSSGFSSGTGFGGGFGGGTGFGN